MFANKGTGIIRYGSLPNAVRADRVASIQALAGMTAAGLGAMSLYNSNRGAGDKAAKNGQDPQSPLAPQAKDAANQVKQVVKPGDHMTELSSYRRS